VSVIGIPPGTQSAGKTLTAPGSLRDTCVRWMWRVTSIPDALAKSQVGSGQRTMCVPSLTVMEYATQRTNA
jgi:hypothetical protein